MTIEMQKYRLICPDCGASIITLVPEAIMWELCPGCYKHGWDSLDIQMAEPINGHSGDGRTPKPPNTMISN